MLYIIYEDNFLAKYILSPLEQKDNIRIIKFGHLYFRGVRRIPWLITKFIRARLRNKKGFLSAALYEKDFIKQINEIRKTDKVLFFSVQNLKELITLDKEIDSPDKSAFIWNPLCTINHNIFSRRQYFKKTHASGLKMFTFDESDALEYDFTKINQIYRYPMKDEFPEPVTEDNGCVFFVGNDKKRSSTLSEYVSLFVSAGLKCDFHILRTKNTPKEENLEPYYSKEWVSYPEYLKRARQSMCMLEILQNGQSGMTVRTLEALFFNKKLITDNKSALGFPFYHPDNIYILDKNCNDNLIDFMKRPYHNISEDIIAPYRIENWIKQFE